MFAPRIRGALLVYMAAAAVACGGSTEPGGGNLTPSAVSIASGREVEAGKAAATAERAAAEAALQPA